MAHLEIPFGERIRIKTHDGIKLTGVVHATPAYVSQQPFFVADGGEHVSLSRIKGWQDVAEPEEKEIEDMTPAEKNVVSDLTAEEMKRVEA